MKKTLFRIISLFCVISIIISTLTIASPPLLPAEITLAETNAIMQAMDLRGINGNEMSTELLYNHLGAPSFLMGVSSRGYIILERDTLAFMECGEGKNPYSDYIDETKFYAGPFCYYAKVGSQIYDISGNTVIEAVPYNSAVEEAVKKYTASRSSSASILASPTTVELANSYDYIQRQAFGNNNDDTCTAVACGIILNYLDKTSNDAIVNSNSEAEYLISNNGANVAANSPNAYQLHRFLVEHCGMGVATYGDGVVSGIDAYRTLNPPIGSTEITAIWQLRDPLTNYCIDAIDSGYPAMITTLAASEYSWHSMVVYGYRHYSYKENEYLIHPGWYIRLDQNGSTWYMPKFWINADFAAYLYQFPHNPG